VQAIKCTGVQLSDIELHGVAGAGVFRNISFGVKVLRTQGLSAVSHCFLTRIYAAPNIKSYFAFLPQQLGM
jgi:hypothetical protein